jgi:hypothetical protein
MYSAFWLNVYQILEDVERGFDKLEACDSTIALQNIASPPYGIEVTPAVIVVAFVVHVYISLRRDA